MAHFQGFHENPGGLYIKRTFQKSRTSLGGVLQGLDVTSGELFNGARKECQNPLTLTTYCKFPITTK